MATNRIPATWHWQQVADEQAEEQKTVTVHTVTKVNIF